MNGQKKQIEVKFEISEGDLRAVIYYSDRSFEIVSIFGSRRKLAEHFNNGQNDVSFHEFSSLGLIPEEGYLVDASAYGYESGKLLLVPVLYQA